MRKQRLTGTIAAAAALYLLRRRGTRWGAAAAEFDQVLPGDEVISNPDLEMTNAVSIRAPADKIWPWIAQMGYYRGGWFTDSTWRDWDYYPDRVLRFFARQEARQSGYSHRDEPTHTHISPEFQHLKAGDVVLDGPPGTAFFTVASIEPNRHLVYHSNSHLRFVFPKSIRDHPRIAPGGEFTWAFYLQAAGEAHTRLIMRTRGKIWPWWYRLFINTTVPIANLFLARKMLGGIQRVSE